MRRPCAIALGIEHHPFNALLTARIKLASYHEIDVEKSHDFHPL